MRLQFRGKNNLQKTVDPPKGFEYKIKLKHNTSLKTNADKKTTPSKVYGHLRVLVETFEILFTLYNIIGHN